MDSEYFCSACEQTFTDRDEYVRGLLFDGQVVSKGSHNKVSEDCCH